MASARSEDIPENVAVQLATNAEQLVPVEISWTYRPRALVSEDRLTADYGESDMSRFHTDRECTVSLDGAKIYDHTRTPQVDETGSVHFQVTEKSFDNEYWYSGTGTKEVKEMGATPVLTIERVADTREQLAGKLFRLDYFENAGFFAAQTAAELGSHPASLVLNAKQTAATTNCITESIEGESCCKVTCVSSSGTTNWWLSETWNYAVVRSETAGADGKVISRTENSDFVKLGDRNVWLPKHTDRYLHRWNYKGPVSETAVVAEEFRVTSISAEAIPPEKFVLNYSDVPGTYVSDTKLADSMKSSLDRLNYQVPAKQEDLDRAIELAALGEDYALPGPTVQRGAAFALIGSLAVGLVLWLLLRKAEPKR